MLTQLSAYLGVIRRHGLARTAWIIRDRISERYHERRLGVETTRIVPMQELGITDAAHFEYAPTGYREFRTIVGRLSIQPGEDVFIDYGSGKGRALLMAAAYPFRRVIGVEFSAALNTIANSNIRQASPHLICKDIVTVVADARTYAVPPDVTMAYFNNPFGPAIFEAVLEQLRDSLASPQRRLTIIIDYPLGVAPVLADIVRTQSWLTVRDEFAASPFRHCVIATTGAANA